MLGPWKIVNVLMCDLLALRPEETITDRANDDEADDSENNCNCNASSMIQSVFRTTSLDSSITGLSSGLDFRISAIL